MTILWGGFGIIQWSDILQIFTYGNMQNMAINLGLSVMHKVPPVSNSACVIPISLQQMHSTNLNMDMNTPFSQLLHKNSFLSNTSELHAWMRKINLSIIKLDYVKIVKLFTFEIRKKNQKHTVNQWLLTIVNFFNVRSSYFWLKTFSPFINVRWRLRPYTIYLRKIYFQKCTLPEYSLFLFVCV